jgi:hypothetical protein
VVLQQAVEQAEDEEGFAAAGFEAVFDFTEAGDDVVALHAIGANPSDTDARAVGGRNFGGCLLEAEPAAGVDEREVVGVADGRGLNDGGGG